MRLQPSIACLLLATFLGCASTPVEAPQGPIARFGTTPTIDGVFDEGEWDDAVVVQAGEHSQFRIKHDGTNLYFALEAGGGDLLFNTDPGLRVLHWSGQLGSAEYRKSDASTQSLERPYAHELWGLQDESPDVIHEALSTYLADNGWAANLASMGHVYESEVAVSFEWLGVTLETGRFVEIPSVRIGAGLLVSKNDPRAEDIMALSREERATQYPHLSWPLKSAPRDSIGMGPLPDTIQLDPADYGRIWIDLES